MHALVLLYTNQHTTFEVPSFTVSKDMIGTVFQRLALDILHLDTNFGDMIAGVEIDNGSCGPDHTLLGMVCHSKARI